MSLTGSPAPIAPEQLDELQIALALKWAAWKANELSAQGNIEKEKQVY